jgi:hypothetical protein
MILQLGPLRDDFGHVRRDCGYSPSNNHSVRPARPYLRADFRHGRVEQSKLSSTFGASSALPYSASNNDSGRSIGLLLDAFLKVAS